MKTLLSLKRYHYMARVGIFLVAVSLIAAMAGCAPAPQHDLAILSTNALAETGTASITPTIDFDPDILNLRSKGQFLTAYIELPPGYDASDIDVSSIRLNGTVPALTKPTAIGDYDSDGIPDLMVKFDRAAVEALLMPASQVEMTITGEVAGTAFEGSNTVRVINPAWCSLNVSSTAGGSVSVPGEGTFSYKTNTVVGLVAIASGGYRFVNWTGDAGTVGDVNAASTNITLNGHYSITANFMAQYDLTISSTAGGSVSAPGEGTFTYDAETVVNLMATPSGDCRFVKWTGDVGTVGDVNAASTNITMNDACSITANFEQSVAFPDANLEQAIRDAINKPTGPIYRSDLKGLTKFSAPSKNIADLTGLEYCTSLMRLALADNRIGDISPLANLTNLYQLDLSHNKISDISPIGNLKWVMILSLGGNQISDISALAKIWFLVALDLDSNQISDIWPVAGMHSLRVLYLDHNQIGNISALTNLYALMHLELNYNQISDISPLAGLTLLGILSLDVNQISDIEPLVDNSGLAYGDTVNLRDNPLSSDSINDYIPQLQGRGVHVSY